MEYIDLRKLNKGELKQVRRQVVCLKKMGKTWKEIEELIGVRQNRASEIWTAYQREGDSSMEPKKRGFQKRTHLLLTPEEQAEIRETIMTRRPEEFGIPGSLWMLKKVCTYVWKRYGKKTAAWLDRHQDKIELFFLPPYAPRAIKTNISIMH